MGLAVLVIVEQIKKEPLASIRIIGTSHIAKESVREIRRVFEEFHPDIVAVELDKRRLASLREGASRDRRVPISMVRQVGVVGWIFLSVGGWLQRKMGGAVRMEPGADMLEAVKIASENKKVLALVDQDVLVTMRRLSSAFTWREKLRVIRDILFAPFSREKISIDLSKVPDAKTLRVLMDMMRKRYPSLYRVIVIERNIYMATRIDRLARATPRQRILLVVGAGHEDDLRKRLSASGQFLIA